jgi:type I restriction enzyme S subunit
MLSVSGYRGVEPKAYDHEEQRRTDEELEDYRVVRPGQLVANTMWLNYSGLGVSRHEGHVSPAYRCYNIGAKYHGQFLHHLMRSSIYVGRYCGLLYGIRPNSLQIKNHDWDSIELLIPPVDEQRAIADFLDRETSKIDALVAKKERLIELLQEKRTALITHAVTKGLDPNAPMKPSGIDWLGDIPAHWSASAFGYVSTRIGDGIHATPEYVDDSTYYFVNGNNLVDGVISIKASTRCVSHGEFEKFKLPLNNETLLLSINGTIGNVAHYRGENVVLGKSAAYINLGLRLNSRFAFYFLRSSGVTRFFEQEVTGTTIHNLSLRSIRHTPVVLPPFGEQIRIADVLDDLERTYKHLSRRVLEGIERLKEYRAALISAAVTGKIDVREPPR